MRTNGQTDRQTDTTKIIVAFRNFSNAPNAVLTLKSSCRIYAIDKDVPHIEQHGVMTHTCLIALFMVD